MPHRSEYVREDHILASLPTRIAELHRRPIDTVTPTADQMVAYLHTNNLMINCDASGWTLQAARQDPQHATTP